MTVAEISGAPENFRAVRGVFWSKHPSSGLVIFVRNELRIHGGGSEGGYLRFQNGVSELSLGRSLDSGLRSEINHPSFASRFCERV